MPNTDQKECKNTLEFISQHGKDLKEHNELWVAEEDRGNDRMLPDFAAPFGGGLARCIEDHINKVALASKDRTDLTTPRNRRLH